MIVPPIVIGVAMYQPLANWGLIGQETAVVIGHVIGALPYLVIIVTAALGNLNPAYERAAASMGAGPIRTFLKVTFPLIRPSVLAGSLFAFIHSFDELVITMLVGGALMQTLPLKMWSDIKNSIDPTIAAVSAILIGAVLLWLVLLHLIYRGRRQNA
jgi:putative spermidine/putrescine transport system permease protein